MIIKAHKPIVLKIANYVKRYKYIHGILKKIYYYYCYLLFSNSFNKYELTKELVPKFLIELIPDNFFGYYHYSPWSYDDKFIAINSIIDSKNIQINIINISTREVTAIDKTT